MASSLIRRAGWPLTAAVAFAFLIGLALHGERPEPGLARFKAAGLLTAFAPDDAREVAIASDGKTWRFLRDGSTWRAEQGPAPADAGGRIDTALRLLRDSGPLRTLSAEEIARMPAAEYALGPNALQVTVLGPGGARFAVRFGKRNPMGSARYAQVEGVEGIPLLPAYVADTWAQAIGRTLP